MTEKKYLEYPKSLKPYSVLGQVQHAYSFFLNVTSLIKILWLFKYYMGFKNIFKPLLTYRKAALLTNLSSIKIFL